MANSQAETYEISAQGLINSGRNNFRKKNCSFLRVSVYLHLVLNSVGIYKVFFFFFQFVFICVPNEMVLEKLKLIPIFFWRGMPQATTLLDALLVGFCFQGGLFFPGSITDGP